MEPNTVLQGTEYCRAWSTAVRSDSATGLVHAAMV